MKFELSDVAKNNLNVKEIRMLPTENLPSVTRILSKPLLQIFNTFGESAKLRSEIG